VARGDGGTTATLGGGLASTVVTTSMVDVRFRDCWGDASTSIDEVVGGGRSMASGDAMVRRGGRRAGPEGRVTRERWAEERGCEVRSWQQGKPVVRKITGKKKTWGSHALPNTRLVAR
jgi:hypothetical protein